MPESKSTPILFNCKHCQKEFVPSGKQRRRGWGCCGSKCGRSRGKFATRFWAKAIKTDNDSCWLWIGSLSEDGYGHIGNDGKVFLAHRMSYELEIGPIPEGMCVCHHCDTPACVRPDHLFVGTHQDNMRDMKDKLRAHLGERSGSAKLTDEKVLEIRRRYAVGDISTRKLGKEFGISGGNVRSIVNRHTWRHLPDEQLAGNIPRNGGRSRK